MSKVLLEKHPYSTPEVEVLELKMESATCVVTESAESVNRKYDYGTYEDLEEI